MIKVFAMMVMLFSVVSIIDLSSEDSIKHYHMQAVHGVVYMAVLLFVSMIVMVWAHSREKRL